MEVFDIFLMEAILNGLLLGGLLALLSLGLNLIFGVIDVVWICYAELIMCGMYAVYYLHVQYHWPLLAAMAAAVAIVAVLGVILHQLVIRPVLTAEPINQLLVTGGVLLVVSLSRKCIDSRGISSTRSRNGGTSIRMTLSRKKRSERNRPAFTSASSRLLLAATIRTSTLSVWVPLTYAP